MLYKDFDIDNISNGIKVINELIIKLEDIDIIKDGLSEVIITSKFPNIFYYKSVSKSLLVHRDDSLLTEYHMLDYYKDMRLLDFIKDNNDNISVNYNFYFKDFINDLNSLYNAYLNSTEHEWWSYDIFRSKLFKQYIINIVHVCMDIVRKLVS